MPRLHLKLLHKIMVTGAIGVLGVITIGAIYLYGAATQEKFQKLASGAQTAYTLANNVANKMLEARRAEKDFLLRSQNSYVDRHNALDKEVRSDIDKLRQQVSAMALSDLVQKVDVVRDGYKTYSAHFGSLVNTRRKLGLDEVSGLEGALRNSVHAIETKLGEFKDPRLVVTMLMMRRHEKDFILRRDAKYGDDMKKRATEFASGVDASTEIVPAAKEDLKQKLAAYQRDFNAWMEAAVTLGHEQKQMSDAFAAIDPVIDAMLENVRDVYKQADASNDASRAEIKLQMQIAIFGIAILVCTIAFWIGRMVSKPITALTSSMIELGSGKFDVVLPGLGRKDEIGDIAAAVETFKVKSAEKARLEADDVLRRQKEEAEAQAKAAEERAKLADEQARVVESLANGLKGLAKGDLTYRLGDGFPDAYAQIRDDFNAAIANLQETIGAIASSAREVSNAAAEISTSTTDLSQRTEEQAASLEQTSASMEEISATVKKNAENAQQANEFTGTTRNVADRGGQVVAEAVSAMARIEESSRKIADIIGVIDEIARQTNLLALNAAVEAARAGEAGRGFAVVASEVRTLAQRSSQAAKDIKDLITHSSGQVQEGVGLVNRAGTSLTEIVEAIKRVADIVHEIASASAEQTTGIEQINKALLQMDEVTQQNSALVEENAASAKTLETQSQSMDQRVRFFHIDGDEAGRQGAEVVMHPAADPGYRHVVPAAKRPAAAAVKPRAPMAKRGPVGRLQAAVATAFRKDPEWEEF